MDVLQVQLKIIVDKMKQDEIRQKNHLRFSARALYVLSFVVNFYILRLTCSGQLLNNFFFGSLPKIDLSNESSKWIIMRSLLSKIGLYVFIHVFFVILTRFYTEKVTPAEFQDPKYTKLFNRIIQNTLEQSVIFVTLYAYFLFDIDHDFTKNEVLVLASWFILSRILYSFYYTLGTALGMSPLRAYGFGINLAVNVIMVELCFCQTARFTQIIFGK